MVFKATERKSQLEYIQAYEHGRCSYCGYNQSKYEAGLAM